MKKYGLAFLMLFAVITSHAQEDLIEPPKGAKNEVKINALFLLLGVFETSYERNLSEDSSLGISLLIPFDNKNLDSDLNYYISPYYRIFFGKKYAAGFFLEGFGMLNSIRNSYLYYSNDNIYSEEKDVTDFALGLGLGGKWFTKGGFVFEVNGGFGRNLFHGNAEDGIPFVGKFGFNIGYRF